MHMHANEVPPEQLGQSDETRPDTGHLDARHELELLRQDVDPQALEVEAQTHIEILKDLEAASNAEARVRTFATLADTYGLDALISLIPEAGDGASSVLAGLYLIYEANNAGLDETAMLKIIALETADFFAGAVPILGDVADYFFQANIWSDSLFKDRVAQLTAEARAAGISEAEIAKITGAAEKLPGLVDKAVGLHKHLSNK